MTPTLPLLETEEAMEMIFVDNEAAIGKVTPKTLEMTPKTPEMTPKLPPFQLEEAMDMFITENEAAVGKVTPKALEMTLKTPTIQYYLACDAICLLYYQIAKYPINF